MGGGYNPGGDQEEQGFPRENRISVETGTAWTHEKWPSQLQKQVGRLFDELIQYPIDQAITGNVVPFRSPDIKRFSNKKNSESFCVEIWKDILKYHCPKLCIANGSDAGKLLIHIFDAREENKIESRYGHTKIIIYKHCKGVLVSIPHLSRHKLFSKDKYIAPLSDAIKQAKSLLCQ